MSRIQGKPGQRQAFTLVELLVGMTLMVITVGIFAAAISLFTEVWDASRNRLATLASARQALGVMTERLAAATLAPRRELVVPGGWSGLPARRDQIAPEAVVTDWYSDLHFISGPVASVLGDTGKPLLTHAAFFVTAPEDGGALPAMGYALEAGAGGPGLVEYHFEESSLEQMRTEAGDRWLSSFFAADPPAGTVAELAIGVCALILQPQAYPGDLTLAPEYVFDSRRRRTGNDPMRNRLPPALGVTLVVLEPVAAERLAQAPPEAASALTKDLFEDASDYENDLAILGTRLDPWGGHRVFRTTVLLSHGLPN